MILYLQYLIAGVLCDILALTLLRRNDRDYDSGMWVKIPRWAEMFIFAGVATVCEVYAAALFFHLV